MIPVKGKQSTFYVNKKTPSGYTVRVEFSMYEDWGKGSHRNGTAVEMHLMTAKKRKNTSFGSMGEITGPGGTEVYIAVVESIKEFEQLAFIYLPPKTPYIRLYAQGYNKRLDDLYRKVLPRLGFKLEYRGEWAMEKIITLEEVNAMLKEQS